MAIKRKIAPAVSKAKQPASRQALPKELKTAFYITLPVGLAAVLFLLWPKLFPVAPEQLVEVAWTHECTCAPGWIELLRAAGFTVRDYELDDISTMRDRWRVPAALDGCHPASYLGYFLDGHLSADHLHRLARERPQAIGIQQADATEPGKDGTPQIVSRQLLLIRSNGRATPWSAAGIDTRQIEPALAGDDSGKQARDSHADDNNQSHPH